MATAPKPYTVSQAMHSGAENYTKDMKLCFVAENDWPSAEEKKGKRERNRKWRLSGYTKSVP